MKIYLIAIFGILIVSCTPEYKVNERIPELGTIHLDNKVKNDFIYDYINLIRESKEFYTLPNQLEFQKKEAKNNIQKNFNRDIFLYINGQEELILHMDYECCNVLINIFSKRKDNTKWLNGTDNSQISNEERDFVKIQYNIVIDSLVSLAKKEGVSDDKIFR